MTRNDAAEPRCRFRAACAVVAVLLVTVRLAGSAAIDNFVDDPETNAVQHKPAKRKTIEMNISNEEFYHKHLEYYRLFYEQESDDSYEPVKSTCVNATTSSVTDNNDTGHVSATQDWGEVVASVEVAVDGTDQWHSLISFPINESILWDCHVQGPLIKSVARIYGLVASEQVAVYGRLLEGGVKPDPFQSEYWSPVGNLTWSTADRWKDLDVTDLLRSPQNKRRHGHLAVATLQLSLRYPAKTVADAKFRFGGENVDDGWRRPVLHSFFEGTAAKRRRRDAPGKHGRTDCKADVANGTAVNKCCRESMKVVFSYLPDYSFVIEPKSFDAGLCRGRCPHKYNSASNHAFLQSLLHKRFERIGAHGHWPEAFKPPRPCCTPSKLKPLQLLRMAEDDPTKLKVVTNPAMQVVECACS